MLTWVTKNQNFDHFLYTKKTENFYKKNQNLDKFGWMIWIGENCIGDQRINLYEYGDRGKDVAKVKGRRARK